MDVSFKVPYGSILGIIGENGSGKTTIMSIILNIKKMSGGKIEIFSESMKVDDTNLKEKLGVSYDDNCFPDIINASEVSSIMSNIYTNWDEDYYISMLRKFNISPFKKIGKYSKGMKKALSIISALAHHPQLLILDEPTSDLDPVHREEMLGLFLEFIEDDRNSIVFSSHITTDIEKIADYVTFLDNGRTVVTEEKDKLIYNYGIIRCGKEGLSVIDEEDIIALLKRDYEFTVLVPNQEKYQNLNHNLTVENPTLEEMLYLLSKGDN